MRNVRGIATTRSVKCLYDAFDSSASAVEADDGGRPAFAHPCFKSRVSTLSACAFTPRKNTAVTFIHFQACPSLDLHRTLANTSRIFMKFDH